MGGDANCSLLHANDLAVSPDDMRQLAKDVQRIRDIIGTSSQDLSTRVAVCEKELHELWTVVRKADVQSPNSFSGKPNARLQLAEKGLMVSSRMLETPTPPWTVASSPEP